MSSATSELTQVPPDCEEIGGTPYSGGSVKVELRTLSAADAAIYLVLGILFGVVLIKSEVVSWFRIQEMFRFQAFHMYGVIGSAVVVGMISLQLIKRLGLRTIHGETIEVASKPLGRGVSYVAGGLIFGIGWGLLGACPGPIYALFGAGVSVIVVSFVAALAGAWTYGLTKRFLPH
ncbi:MAG: DUF6691 family protein [Rhodothermales bacterium]